MTPECELSDESRNYHLPQKKKLYYLVPQFFSHCLKSIFLLPLSTFSYLSNIIIRQGANLKSENQDCANCFSAVGDVIDKPRRSLVVECDARAIVGIPIDLAAKYIWLIRILGVYGER